MLHVRDNFFDGLFQLEETSSHFFQPQAEVKKLAGLGATLNESASLAADQVLQARSGTKPPGRTVRLISHEAIFCDLPFTHAAFSFEHGSPRCVDFSLPGGQTGDTPGKRCLPREMWL